MSKGLVSKATADDVKPVTGLQLKNLADATLDPRECEIIRDALLSRLDDSSPFVKAKALRIIKYVCQHGKLDFRMELQRGAGNSVIKEHLSYRGTPHETRGDAPNAAVREEAKAALAAIFGSAAANEPAAAQRDNIVGFGSNGANAGGGGGAGSGAGGGYGGGGGGGGGASDGGYGAGTYGGNISINVSRSGNMIGFGNPAFENAKEEPGVLEQLGKLNEKIVKESKGFLDKVKDAVTGQTDAPFRPYAGSGPYQGAGAGYGPGQGPPAGSGGGGGGFGGAGGAGGFGSGSERGYQPTQQNHATVPYSTAAPTGGRQKGQVGGGWGSEAPASVPRAGGAADPYPGGGYAGGAAGGGGGGFAAAAAAAAASPSSPQRTHAGPGEFEKKIVTEIVQPSGVRPLPTPQELQAFVKKCQSLDSYDVALLVDAKLAPDVQQPSQLKAMAVLDAMLNAGSPVTEGVVEFYREHSAQNTHLLPHENSAVALLRKGALNVLRKVGLRAQEAAVAAPEPALGSASSQYAAAAAGPTAAAASGSLFDVSNIPQAQPAAGAQAAAVDSATSLFGNLTVKPAQPQPQPQVAAGGGFDIFGGAAPAAQPAPQPAPQPQVAAASNDPFGALYGQKPAVTAANTDPFSALYAAKKPAQPAPSGPFAALQSSFPPNGGAAGGGSSNPNFLSSSGVKKPADVFFTVTAAQPAAGHAHAHAHGAAASASPARPHIHGSGGNIQIDPFADAFGQPQTGARPVSLLEPSAAAKPASSSNSSGFGFIAANDKSDPFGSLVQLK